MSRAPLTGEEKEGLCFALDRHRDVVLWKLEGLDDEQVKRPLTESGMSLLSLLKHLAVGQYDWFVIAFGRPAEPLPDVSVDENADWILEPEETKESVLAFFARARAASDQVINELDVTDTGVSDSGTVMTLRWVLIHQLEEFARHAGHADILRERLDGEVGYFPRH